MEKTHAQEADIRAFRSQTEEIRAQIAKEIVGQQEVVDHMLMALIAGGNVLLEGVPGLGKTRLVRTLSNVFDLPFSRIQFTPDLMPADITGTNIIVKGEAGNEFRFQPGPLFASIVLADEINRATPKTQAALLEAMQEHSVTVAGETHALSEPYFVLATQNPVEQEGTYPLPEAQLDRFLIKMKLGQHRGHDRGRRGAAGREGGRRRRASAHACRGAGGARGQGGQGIRAEAAFEHASGNSRKPGNFAQVPALRRESPRGAGVDRGRARARADGGTLQRVV